jgi:hypothetical protein
MQVNTGPVIQTGVYDLSDADYHADPCPSPSLNNTIAKVILRSPAHAYQAHPRLGRVLSPVQTKEMLIGSATHISLFGGQALIRVIDADSFRTKAAQEERDSALAAGDIPLLADDARLVESMTAVARPYVDSVLPKKFLTETTLCVQEGEGLWRRGKVDACTTDLELMADYKTAVSIADADLPFVVDKYGYAMQQEFYKRLARGVGATDPRFTFIFQEKDPPYCVRVVELDEAYAQIGANWVERATRAWDRAIVSGVWPGYSEQTKVSPTSRALNADISASFDDEGAA